MKVVQCKDCRMIGWKETTFDAAWKRVKHTKDCGHRFDFLKNGLFRLSKKTELPWTNHIQGIFSLMNELNKSGSRLRAI